MTKYKNIKITVDLCYYDTKSIVFQGCLVIKINQENTPPPINLFLFFFFYKNNYNNHQ